MRKVLTGMACIVVAMLLVATTASFVSAAVATDGPRVYHGPKEVYRDMDTIRKGKPPGTPGGGPPEKPPKEPEPDPSIDKWAVVIGISDYRGKADDLQYCDDDARDMYNYLIAQGYPEGNIKLLLDRDAKAKAIMKAIEWLDYWEGSGSEVVFFYSGHGSTYDGYDDGDSEDIDEGIVSADLYLILDGQLRQKFSAFESQKISFIFDSCFSGGMDDLVGAWTGTIDGRVVVAACGETGYSYDGTSDQQNGVFTYFYVGTDNAGLQTYNTIEGAFNHAAQLAANFVAQNYPGAQMDPQMHDEYEGDWGDWTF